MLSNGYGAQSNYRRTVNEYLSKRNNFFNSQKQQQTLQNLKHYEQELREKQERSTSRNWDYGKTSKKHNQKQTNKKCRNNSKNENAKKGSAKPLIKSKVQAPFMSPTIDKIFKQSQNTPIHTDYWNQTKNKENKSKKQKKGYQMSDRSMTPQNFHFFDKISEEVQLLSSRGSLLKNKKKSVTFIDEPVALNEKKKRRSLKAKVSKQFAQRQRPRVKSSFSNFDKKERRKLKNRHADSVGDSSHRSFSQMRKASVNKIQKSSKKSLKNGSLR